MTYRVNEIFYSIQGEGARAGSPNVFVRFAGCNLACDIEPRMHQGETYVAGFRCDTEFVSYREYGLRELLDAMAGIGPERGRSCILTGGEPSLQVDRELLEALKEDGWYVAMETNGTTSLPEQDMIDWVCVSPKTAFHTVSQREANEFKLVRRVGQELPGWIPCSPRKDRPVGLYRLVSPAFDGGSVSRETLEWCIELVKKNPGWRLSCQQHVWWGVR